MTWYVYKLNESDIKPSKLGSFRAPEISRPASLMSLAFSKFKIKSILVSALPSLSSKHKPKPQDTAFPYYRGKLGCV